MAKRVSADRWLFTVTLCLVFVGLVMVFSASAVIAKERYGSGYTFLFRQLVWAVTGIIAMFVAMKLDYRRSKHPAVVFSVLPRPHPPHPSLDSLGKLFVSAFGNCQTGADSFSGIFPGEPNKIH
jgi:hypothetical protein